MPLAADYNDRAKQFNFATPDEVRAALTNPTAGTTTILLDVRSAGEITAGGRISQYDDGSKAVLPKQTPATPTECIALSESPTTVFGTDDKNITIVIYCGSGRRAALARKILQDDHGYTGPILNAGGYQDIKTILET